MRWMGKLVFLTLLCGLAASAFASSATFTNAGGTLTGTNGGTTLTLSGSVLTSVTGLGPLFNDSGSNLGVFNIKTGPLMSGSLDTGATFGAGGTFRITDINAGLIFTGAFTSATWTPVSGLPPGQFGWTLSGTITGTLNGEAVTGITVQLTTIVMGNNPFAPGGPNKIKLSGGNTSVPTVVAEPSTIGLLSTGILGLFCMKFRRR